MKSGDSLKLAELKLDAAFDFFTKIKTPYFCFHDRDLSPEGDNFLETKKYFDHMVNFFPQL